MSRLATSFVLGYHGCDQATAQKAVLEGAGILRSETDYDWLGPGAYFWESDPTRAWEWARWKAKKGHYGNPAVIGAVIDFRNCLDLVAREDIDLFRSAYKSFTQAQKKSGLSMPRNTNPKGAKGNDRLLRYLDCAVIRHLHHMIEENGLEPFDTVRGMFVEGGRVYRGSGIYQKSHVQIAVINRACIKGIFFPPKAD